MTKVTVSEGKNGFEWKGGGKKGEAEDLDSAVAAAYAVFPDAKINVKVGGDEYIAKGPGAAWQ